MQFTIPQHMQDQKAENIKRFPALAIGLTQEEIDRQTPGNRILALTSHQKDACRHLASEVNWHPMYIAECCPTARPALLQKYGDLQWGTHCLNWQEEHDLSVADLAAKYKAEFAKIADRLFLPLDRHSDGVAMSAHDNSNEKYPCEVSAW